MMVHMCTISKKTIPQLPAGNIINHHFVTHSDTLTTCNTLNRETITFPGIQEVDDLKDSVSTLQTNINNWYTEKLTSYKLLKENSNFIVEDDRFLRPLNLGNLTASNYECHSHNATLLEIQTLADLELVNNIINKIERLNATTIWQLVSPLLLKFADSNERIPTFLNADELVKADTTGRCVIVDLKNQAYKLENCTKPHFAICEIKISEIELFHDKLTYDNFKNGILQLLNSIDILGKALKPLPVQDISTIRLTNANLFEKNIYNNLKNLENIDDQLSNKVMRQLENNKITIEHLTNLVTTKDPTILDFLNKCSGCSTKLENEKDKMVTISQVGKYNTNSFS